MKAKASHPRRPADRPRKAPKAPPPPAAATRDEQPAAPRPEEQLKKLFEVWVDSELKAQVVIFFNNNPGVVETVEGLARRLGLNPVALGEAVADHVKLGVLEERQLGAKKVLVFNRDRRNQIQDYVTQALRRRSEATP